MRAVFDATESKEGRLALSRADLLYPPHATMYLHQPPKYINILCMETEETYREAITLFLKSSGIYSLFPMPWQDTGWGRVTSCFALCPIQSGAHYPSTLCFTAHTNTLKKYPSPLLPHIQCSICLGHGAETWLACEWLRRPMSWNCLRNKWATRLPLYWSRLECLLIPHCNKEKGQMVYLLIRGDKTNHPLLIYEMIII